MGGRVSHHLGKQGGVRQGGTETLGAPGLGEMTVVFAQNRKATGQFICAVLPTAFS